MKRAHEIYDSMFSFMKDACTTDAKARQEVITKYKMTKLETVAFENICTNQSNNALVGLHKCSDVETEYQKQLQNESNEIENKKGPTLHHSIAGWYCFQTDPKNLTEKSLLNRDIGLLINEWPLRLLNNINSDKVYTIVGRVSKAIMEFKKEYLRFEELNQTKTLKNINILGAIREKTGDSLSNYMDQLSHMFVSNDTKFQACIDYLNKRITCVEDAFVAMEIAKRNERTNKIMEHCVYSYYDMNLGRKTDVIIPKDLFNWVQNKIREMNQKMGELKQMKSDIDIKRNEKEYTDRLVIISEKDRSQRHRRKNKTHNSNKKAKTPKVKKKKKPKKKVQKKKKTVKKKRKKSDKPQQKNNLNKYFAQCDEIKENEEKQTELINDKQTKKRGFDEIRNSSVSPIKSPSKKLSHIYQNSNINDEDDDIIENMNHITCTGNVINNSPALNVGSTL